jgi:hypothetical protein
MEDQSKLTKEFRISEFLRCKENFGYFCSKYIEIEMPGGNIPLKLYSKQEELVQVLHTKHYILVLKTRQTGVSTIIQAYIVWLHVFYDNVVVGVLSKDGPEATSFARHIMSMIDNLPTWLVPKYVKRTEQTYILENGSQCHATTINPNAPEKTLRGKALTFLVVDEGAFINHVDDAWTGMMPALATNQLHASRNKVPYGTIIISTPNKTVGIGKWFYARYVSSVSGDDIFKPFIIHWKMIPELADDPAWYNTQCQLAGNDPKKIQQELDLKFLSTSGSFFDEKTIQTLQDIDIEPIERMRLFGGECWTFVKPQEGRYYITGVDTAPQHGQDKSAITVWDYQTLEQVWEYQVKCSVMDFIKVVKLACSMYPGLVVVENTGGYGNQVVEAMMNSEFLSMVYKGKTSDTRIVPGLSTNIHTRPLMIESLYSYVVANPQMIKSKRLALELIGLINKSGKVQADIGCTDDLSLSASCAFYVRKWDPPLILTTSSADFDNSFLDIVKMNISSGEHTYEDLDSKMQNMIDEIIDEKKGTFIDVLSLYDKM